MTLTSLFWRSGLSGLVKSRHIDSIAAKSIFLSFNISIIVVYKAEIKIIRLGTGPLRGPASEKKCIAPHFTSPGHFSPDLLPPGGKLQVELCQIAECSALNISAGRIRPHPPSFLHPPPAFQHGLPGLLVIWIFNKAVEGVVSVYRWKFRELGRIHNWGDLEWKMREEAYWIQIIWVDIYDWFFLSKTCKIAFWGIKK